MKLKPSERLKIADIHNKHVQHMLKTYLSI